jgi:hypothetical protein
MIQQLGSKGSRDDMVWPLYFDLPGRMLGSTRKLDRIRRYANAGRKRHPDGQSLHL